ncbi:uncharacterized protein LOC135834142 [Planococcus citri]|uniref:uncharacterized protein LOC135834142 n=1 Tax=Planococcus citri TaxID=170843 RepID=UPI0031F7B939
MNIHMNRAAERKEADCVTSNTGLITADCSKSTLKSIDSFTIYSIRNTTFPKSLQVIDLSGKTKDLDPNSVMLAPFVFDEYQLQRIIIRRHHQFVGRIGPDAKFILTTFIRRLKSLEYFELSDCDLRNEHVIGLPENLKILNVDYNLYTRLDVETGSKLEEISAKGNRLRTVPQLSTSSSLKTLRLSGNPLQDMTIVDLAPFCSLRLLEVKFPVNSFYTNEDGFCECMMLIRYAKYVEVKLEGLGNVDCFSSDGDEDESECSDDVFKEAIEVRRKRNCPLPIEESDAFTIAVYVFIISLILLLSTAAVLFVIRLNRKESSAMIQAQKHRL